MILATHALVGAAIGDSIDNTWLIIATSLVVHYFLDSFRHGEYVESFDSKVAFKNTWWKSSLDIFLSLLAIFLIVNFKNMTPEKISDIWVGSLASMFPDMLTLIYWKFKIPLLGKIYRFHAWVHQFPRHAPERAWTLRNAANDIIFSLIAIIILFVK
ncbi:MAG: hypothetical protein WC238_03645 [Parcubacteria group bacterium]|jgi:hypothetical protein